MLISAIYHLKNQNREWRNVALYGQEINALTSAIGRMNLFLHGVKDFYIVNDDTLKNPAFIEKGKLKTFDIVLANPPYSISQWDRSAFEADKYGRNFLGVPPQGRADYAFLQHILKSLDKETGRCAILFPHGVLFRNEESHMRKKLIESDLIECIIGLAPNLFYNAPMEACIMICRTSKPKDNQGKILFINAIKEVTRKNAESYLEDKHIEKIGETYKRFDSVEGFSKLATIEDVAKNDYLLSIPLYVHKTIRKDKEELLSVNESYEEWLNTVELKNISFEKLNALVDKEGSTILQIGRGKSEI